MDRRSGAGEQSRKRIEAETIDRARVAHHDGHGGNGVQWSWGTARDALALALADPA